MRVHFRDFCFDSEKRELSERGTAVHLTPKAQMLLGLLLEQRPRVVGKEEIYKNLWPDTFVEDSNLSVLIAEVRSALRDEARRAQYIKTAHGFGYGFIGEARDAVHRPATNVRIRSGSREYELLDGENIVGRDHAAAVRLNAPGISRHHARIIVSPDRVTIQDLGSKNGTWVRGRRIEDSAELNDGDEIRISRELLVMLRTSPAITTLTESG